jgi:hypothetical protein
MDFYDSLISMTFTLCAFVGSIYGAAYYLASRPHAPSAGIFAKARFFVGYLLLFAFPIVSVDLVEAFACHEVEGTYFLRADYSIECYTPRFYRMAAYASLWIVGYIFAFPILLFCKLRSYHEKLARGKGDRKFAHYSELKYGFLIKDYKYEATESEWNPCIMW